MTTTSKPTCIDGTQAHRWKLGETTREGTPAYCLRCRQKWLNPPPVTLFEDYWRRPAVTPRESAERRRMARSFEWVD